MFTSSDAHSTRCRTGDVIGATEAVVKIGQSPFAARLSCWLGEDSVTGGPHNERLAQSVQEDFRMNGKVPNRWLIAAAGILMQIALGAVYAWSVFRIPLTKSYGWTLSQVTLAFELAILTLGFASFAGGLWMRRAGPPPVAAVAALCVGPCASLPGQARGHIVPP